MTTAPSTSTAPSFAQLQERVRRAGLFDARPGYYAAQAVGVAVLMISGWALVVAAGDTWWQLACALYLAFAFGQTALLFHDAGHAQITRRRRARELACYVLGDILLGISAGWWVPYHNRHHSYPNHVTRDPDILNRPIVVRADLVPDAPTLRRVVIRHQRFGFFPLLMFDGIGFRVLSLIALGRRQGRRIALEVCLIGLHLAAYVTVLASIMSPGKAVAFIAVHHAAFGLYIGAMLAPNHKGMAVIDRDDVDWVTRQVLTARNVRGGPVTDYLYGGLNYQIEHHLFPSMPRPNLRRSRPIVAAYCREHGLPYHEVSLFRSYAEVVSHLDVVSRSWRRVRMERPVSPP
jgi:fatty acid desaturase